MKGLKKRYEAHTRVCTKNEPLGNMTGDLKGFVLRKRSQWDINEAHEPSNDLSDDDKQSECLICDMYYCSHMDVTQLLTPQGSTQKNFR